MDEYEDLDWEEKFKIRESIYSFSQYDNESLTEAWVRLKELLKNCYRHGFDRREHVIIFYERLNSDSQHYLDLAGGGDFYYMTPNEVYRMMEDLVEECKYDEDDLDSDRVEMVEIENEVKEEPRELLSGDIVELSMLERSSEDEITPVDVENFGEHVEEVVVDIGLVNPVEEIVKGHFDPFVEKRVATKEDLVGVASLSEVEDFNPFGDVRVVEEEELEEIDPDPNDGLNGKNFNALNIIDKSFVVCDFDLQDSDLVVEAYDLNAEFLEVFGNGDVGLMGALEELDTGGVEHLYFDPFDEIRVTKEEELTEIALDPDPKDFEEEIFAGKEVSATHPPLVRRTQGS